MEPYVEELARRLVHAVRSRGLPYRWLANLYRGGKHPCAYCYATGSHAHRGHAGAAGYESHVTVKVNGPDLLRRELDALGDQRGSLCLGAAYDPYGPAELRFRLTQRAIAAACEAGRPVCLITNSALVLRDLALLVAAARGPGLQVVVTLCSLDEAVWRHVEPEASTPAGRLAAMERLAAAGVPVGLALAPLLPDLTDHEAELEELTRRAAESGSRFLLPCLAHLERGSAEWALPGIRALHPYLPPQYVRYYRGPHPPERYTHAMVEVVEGLRQRFGLAEGVVLQAPAGGRGQLALL